MIRKVQIWILMIGLCFFLYPVSVYAEEESNAQDDSLCIEDAYDEDLMTSSMNSNVVGFIERLYTIVLGRDSDPQGLKSWYDNLVSGRETGTDVAYGFVFSGEFLNKKHSNETYVEILYRTLLNRTSDQAGKDAWVHQLNNGVTRRSVFNGMVNSEEFNKLCGMYGIIPGVGVSSDICDQNPQVNMYVYRCYEVFLGRQPDEAGFRNWVAQFLNASESPQRITYGFVFSSECKSKKLDNEAFVSMMYRGLFDREPDEAGLRGWVHVLESGSDRLNVYKGFVFSDEYRKMISRYGLSLGNDILSDYDACSGELNAIRAQAYIAYDENAGSIICGKNIDREMRLASQIKLMTALVVLDHVSDLSTQATMTPTVRDTIPWDASICGLVIGRTYTIQTLLEGMLVYSGGDCANLLAYHVGGNIENFVKMMNEKAAELGMAQTYFEDPIGMYDNHSTLTQYIKLAAAAQKNPIIASIVAMPNCRVEDVTGYYGKSFSNTNNLVSGSFGYDRNLYIVDGMKTGMTDEAGYCLTTSSFNSAGNRVITVVLHSTSYSQRALDSRYLLDAVYNNNLRGYYCLR